MSAPGLTWNNSNLSLLQRCGEAYRRRVIEEDPDAPTPSLIRGSTVHAIAKVALRRKMGKTNAELPTVEEARDLAADDFEQRWDAQEVRLVEGDEEDGADAMSRAKADAKDFAVALSGYHVAELAPRLRPVAIERKIIVKPQDSDLQIHGTLDVITQPEPPAMLAPLPEAMAMLAARDTIRDLKTSAKSPSRDAADKSQQLSFYAMIRAAEVGALPEALALDYLVRTPKRGDLKAIELATTRDAGDITALVARLNTAVEAVKRGIFMPADPATAWWCSETACSYWTTCPYTRRSRRPTS